MINGSYKVIENVLSKDDFKDVRGFLLGSNFPYYFNSTTDGKDGIEMFSHLVVNNLEINSDAYKFFSQRLKSLFQLIKEETEANTILRIKVNLYPKTKEKMLMGIHTDFENSEIQYLTCVYNLTTCDGFTGLFLDNKEIKIDSKANQLILFDGQIEHYGSTSTDENRLIINFDFIKGENETTTTKN